MFLQRPDQAPCRVSSRSVWGGGGDPPVRGHLAG